MPRTLLLLLALSVPAIAQTSSQPDARPPVQTLKANAHLVVVDVVVTDKNQNPIHNLKQSDFGLLEGKTPQNISHFEEHLYPPTNATPFQALPPMPPGIFTNFTALPPSSALNILLLDTLNTPMTDQSYVRNQLKLYLKTARPGVPTAIFGLTTRLILLQGFSSDPELLKAVMDKKRPGASPLLDNPTGTSNPEALSEIVADTKTGMPNAAKVIASLQQFEAQQQSFQIQLRAKYTLDAMNQLARYLSNLPGRKNLIWFSGSFPINILPDGDLTNPFAAVASSEQEFRETTDLLTASQVAVYPVDARGLMVSPNFSAANSGSKYARSPTAFGKDEAKFFQQTASEHSTMLAMAEQTGGHAFINTNGLAQAVATAVNSGSNYYTLTYTPSDPSYNGKFRKIKVNLDHQGANLAYRRGYYAVDVHAPKQLAKAAAPATPPAPKSQSQPEAPPQPDPLQAAMLHGAPDPTQIIFKVRVLPASLATEDTLATRNNANPRSSVARGPYRRYVVDLAADSRSVLFAQSTDGLFRGDVQLRTYVYDEEGTLLINSIDTTHAAITAATLNQLRQIGIQLHQEISVPVKGTYFLRIGIRDLNGDRLGAVEVPIAAVKNLPPLPAPGTPPAAPQPAHP
jgi:VWFA-related protein